MSDEPGPRLLVLAAVALVVLLVTLALSRDVDPKSGGLTVSVPLDGGWQVARIAPLAPGALIAGCSYTIGAATEAVSHPTLPCGLRIVLEVGGTVASAQVAGRAPAEGDAVFGVTPALGRALGLATARDMRWALAASG